MFIRLLKVEKKIRKIAVVDNVLPNSCFCSISKLYNFGFVII